MNQFCHLHVHSEFSLLDGLTKIDELAARVKELGMPAVSLTDHGSMNGAIQLINSCKKHGVKPIIGNEIYIINGNPEERRRYRKYHLTVLTTGTVGYRNLCQLTSYSNLNGMQGSGIFKRPCINKEILEQYNEGLIILSGCMGSELGRAAFAGDVDRAIEIASWYKNTFGDRYYIEIQDHGIEGEAEQNTILVTIAKQLDIPLVATNDSHYTTKEQVNAHDVLLCIQTKKLVSDEKRMKYTQTEYIKTRSEMEQLFAYLTPEERQSALDNTLVIAERCTGEYDLFGENFMPPFECPDGLTEDQYLERLTYEGLRRRGLDTDEYRTRAARELTVLADKGYAGYFLVVADFIQYARDNSIPVGPGRGSAAGSVVAYATGITNIDPIKYGLLFERFLNPERDSFPDIDVDLCIKGRGRVIDYVTDKYGSNKVAQIATYGTLATKAAIKDVGRALDVSFDDTNALTKMIPVVRGKPAKIKELISEETPSPDFKDKYEKDSFAKEWIDLAKEIEGTNKSMGVHAAGVVISREPISSLAPLVLSQEGNVTVGYPMEDCEQIGLVKMDFLGLKNLTQIKETLDTIKEVHGKEIDIDSVPFDEAIQGMLERGESTGLFQIESTGMQEILRDLRPGDIEDVSTILSLYRPGPLDAGMIPVYCDRKNGKQEVEYLHPMLEPILGVTYGVMVYQEQIQKIACDLGGYTLGEADLLRRAMGKKKVKVMDAEKPKFIAGCQKNGIALDTANAIWDQMYTFAAYGFNRSHSMAYAHITWQTAWLKAHYPGEFATALLNGNADDKDYISTIKNDAATKGVNVKPPSVNGSATEFTFSNGNIYYGLDVIKGCSTNAIKTILEKRPAGGWQDLQAFIKSVDNQGVDSRTIQSLSRVGAFDEIHPNRHEVETYLTTILLNSKHKKGVATGQLGLFDMTDFYAPMVKMNDFSKEEKMTFELELTGSFMATDPFEQFLNADYDTPSDMSEFLIGKKVSLVALIGDIKVIVTKRGDSMAFGKITDGDTDLEIVLFPKVFSKFSDIDTYSKAKTYEFVGKIDERNGELQFVVSDIKEAVVPTESVFEMSYIDFLDKEDEIIRYLSHQKRGRNSVKIILTGAVTKSTIELAPEFHTAQPLRRITFDG